MAIAPKISSDVVVAISETALNMGWVKMFGAGDFGAELKLEGEDWEIRDARIAAPKITFLPADQCLVRLTMSFVGGKFISERWNKKKQAVEKKKYDLAGKHVSFEVMLNRFEIKDFHDGQFTAQALYFNLTQVANIDALSLGFDTDDLASIGEVVKGLVADLQRRAANDRGLFAGRVIVPKTADTVGPLEPTAAAFAATCLPEHPETGELDFLLMMRGRDLPHVANEHLQRGFPSPLVHADGAIGHDAALVLSDRVLLESVAIPVALKAFDGILLALSDPDASGQSAVTQVEVLKLSKRGASVQNLKAVLSHDTVRITVDLDYNERLQTGDGPKDVDFSLVEVILKKTLTYDLKLKINAEGLLAFDFKEGEGNRDEPKPDFKFNYEVHGIKDIVKYLGGPLVLIAGPFAGPLVAIFIEVIEGIALAIQTGIVDVMALNDLARDGLGLIGALDTQLQLPGDPVFRFSDLAAGTQAVVIGADFVKPPELMEGTAAPYTVRPFPRITDAGSLPCAQTDPELIGEAAIKYRYVRDPRFNEGSRQNMPWYILRREQFWHRQSSQEYPAQSEQSKTIETIRRIQSIHQETMTHTLSMEISAKGALDLGGFAPEFAAEMKNELVVNVEDKIECEQTDTITKEFTLESRDKPFGISVWVLIERYTLMRADRSVVNQWDFANADYIQIDQYSRNEKTIQTTTSEKGKKKQ